MSFFYYFLRSFILIWKYYCGCLIINKYTPAYFWHEKYNNYGASLLYTSSTVLWGCIGNWHISAACSRLGVCQYTTMAAYLSSVRSTYCLVLLYSQQEKIAFLFREKCRSSLFLTFPQRRFRKHAYFAVYLVRGS